MTALPAPPGAFRRTGMPTRQARHYRLPANRYARTRLRQLFLWRMGLLCPHDMIAEVLYGDDPTGGPLRLRDAVTASVNRLRYDGWRIEAQIGRGYICHDAPVRPPRRLDLDPVLNSLLMALTEVVPFAPVPLWRLEPYYNDIWETARLLSVELEPYGARVCIVNGVIWIEPTEAA